MGEAGEVTGGHPSASILLLDVHGEYSRALQSISTVFRVNPSDGEEPLHIPFWALNPADLLAFLMGKLDDKAMSQILDKVLAYKMDLANAVSFSGLDVTSMTADSPVPFSLKKLWFELVDPEIKTWEDSAKTQPALMEAGDAETLRAPKYKPNGLGSTAPFINNIGVLSIRRPLDQMRSRLLDRRYDFLLHPGAWEPRLDGSTEKDLPDLLSTWLGHGKPITILDLSGIPSAVLTQLIAAILMIIYEGLFWGREKSEGGIHRPMLVVMEEAHRYLSKEGGGPARDIVQRIVKEGRKFGIGAMIVSQRPAEVDETILSQCGTFIALRLSNAADRSKVQGALPDNLSGIVESLPVLRTGEAVITGEAARLPLRCRIALPNQEHRPQSEDPAVAKRWRDERVSEDYSRLAASWRAQNTLWAATRAKRDKLNPEEIADMEREMVSSSTIISAGYEPVAETLEIEFKSGGVYQYYNVPESVFQDFMASDSKGKFHHVYIKNSYPYSRV